MIRRRHGMDTDEIRKSVRDFLREVDCVPFRAADCNQDLIHEMIANLKELSNYKERVK